MAKQDRREGGVEGVKGPGPGPRRGPYIVCAIKFVIAIYLCNAFLWQFICFKRVFARTVDFDDSLHVRIQTVILIFLIYRNWFYPSESVVGVVGLLSFRSRSFLSAFESLLPSSTSSDCNNLVWTRHY